MAVVVMVVVMAISVLTVASSWTDKVYYTEEYKQKRHGVAINWLGSVFSMVKI